MSSAAILAPAARDRAGRAAPLGALLVVLLAAYGALGRDVFFNHLAHAAAAEDDPVARALPYLRAGLALGIIAMAVARDGLERAFSAVPLALAPFCLLALASTAWSTDPKGTLRDAGTLAALWMALPMLAARLGPVATARAMLHLIAGVLVASAALALLVPEVGRHSGDEFIQFSHVGRWRGLFGHKNGLGPWAALGSVLLFTHARLMAAPRAWLWLARASAVACLILSGSVTALILAALLWCWQAATRFGLALGVAAGLACGVAVAFGSPLEQALDALGRGATLSGRTEIWALALDQIAENPWLGGGYQRFGGADFLAEAGQRFGQPLPGPESGYLAVLLDLGLIGALLLALPVAAALRIGVTRPDRPDDREGLSLLSAVLIASLAAAITETGALVCNGSPGTLTFAALLALLASPCRCASR